MAAHYRLTCPDCSADIQVSLTQAGGTATCNCGVEVPIPKMLDLKKLPQVEDSTTPAKKAGQWSPAQGAVFGLGVLLIAIGAYLHFQVASERAGLQVEQPEFPEFTGDLGLMTENQAWGSWVQLRTLKLQNRDMPEFIKNRERYGVLTNYLHVAWTAAAIGGVLIIVSLFLGGSGNARTNRSK